MFKLLIECSKDIDTLSINFSDGTSVVTTKDDNHKEEKIKKPKQEPPKLTELSERKKPLDNYLNTDEDYSISQEVIKKPEIPDTYRPPKITDELQNLDL